MSECAGQWFVCVCAEGVVDLVVAAVPVGCGVWRKRVDLAWMRCKLVVRWPNAVSIGYVQRRLHMCISVRAWSKEIDYMASLATREAVKAKLKAEYVKVYDGLSHTLWYQLQDQV